MEQIKLEDVISNLELNIRWIEDIPAHQFAGYGNVVMAMRDALELLERQEPRTVLSDRNCEVYPNYYVRKGFCPNCHQAVEWLLNREYCGFCGQGVKWN